MHTPVIKSRDGLKLVSYLSLPPGSDPDGDGVPNKPVPMVLNVHGGPWARDEWGFNPDHQWLANRGYAVLSVNYRGSTGFGKEFINAANGEWAGKMHDDLIDAVNWAVEKKIADKDKVAIMGGSYGGYATLVGLTFTPDVFACGVDIVGPSSLVTLLQNVPPYWMPFMPVMKVRVGDVDTEEGRAALLEALAADARRQDQEAAADRPGRERPAREAARGRSDRQGDEGEEDPRHLRALSRRRPRLPPAGEPHVVQRRDRSVPGRAPRRPVRADRQRFQGLDDHSARRRRRGAGPQRSAWQDAKKEAKPAAEKPGT